MIFTSNACLLVVQHTYYQCMNRDVCMKNICLKILVLNLSSAIYHTDIPYASSLYPPAVLINPTRRILRVWQFTRYSTILGNNCPGGSRVDAIANVSQGKLPRPMSLVRPCIEDCQSLVDHRSVVDHFQHEFCAEADNIVPSAPKLALMRPRSRIGGAEVDQSNEEIERQHPFVQIPLWGWWLCVAVVEGERMKSLEIRTVPQFGGGTALL